jgi:outer membrane protein OmpA-like peptidoglycan-associated protein
MVVVGALLTGVAPATVSAQEDQSNHGAAFLRAGVDARYFGMGGTGAATANDASAAYWNPAGLSLLNGLSITGMYTGGLAFDRNHNYVGVAYGFDRFALALSWISAGTSDITSVDQGGVSGDVFDFSENAILLSAATISGPVSLGITGKLVTQDLGTGAPSSGEDSVEGLGIDLGVQFALTEYVRLGLAVQDLFTQVGDQDNGDVNQIPSNLRVGAAVSPADGLTLGLDLEKERDNENYRLHAGGEYWVPIGDDFRGALRLGVDDGEFAGGFGVGVSFFELNYAYVVEPEDFLDENHRFSVNLDFGDTDAMYRDRTGRDRDGDGIADAVDDCPDEPEDFDGYQDTDGCPDLDNDGDGILDRDDDCPNEPETFNGFEDSDGCPDEAPIYFPLAHINFKFGTAEISGADPIPVLEEVVRIMKDNPNIRVEIQGHTDSIGSDESNQTLSVARSEAVKAYLLNRGIDGSRLQTRGFGETRPIDSNDTDLGRARNRRIEFVVVK